MENKNVKTNEESKAKKIEPKKRNRTLKEHEKNENNKQEIRAIEQKNQITKIEEQSRNRSTKRPRRSNKKASKDVKMKKSPLKIIPLGGLLEIGKNITVF